MKHLVSWKKVQKCLESWKNTTEFSPKTELKTCFKLMGGSTPYPYTPFFVGDFLPTFFTGASAPKSWMKNNRFKVSESYPSSEFSTFFLLRFWYKFYRHFHDWEDWDWEEEKKCCLKFFQAQKMLTFEAPYFLMEKLKIYIFFTNVFFHDSKHFLNFLSI